MANLSEVPLADITLENWERNMSHNHVIVDPRRLREDCYLAVRRGEKFSLPTWDTTGIFPKSDEAFSRFVFWVNVVNFNFSHPVKLAGGDLLKYRVRDIFGKEQRGAYAMIAAFYRAFGEEPILTRHMRPHLASLGRMKRFFKGFNSVAMIEDRRRLLGEACDVLDTYFYGDPKNVLEASDYLAFSSGDKMGIFYRLMTFFPRSFGSDYYKFNGLSLCANPFLFFTKRINLFMVMYHDRAVHSEGALSLIQDIDRVGPIPDYELPRSYETDQIFKYSNELKQMIQSAVPLRRGSQMELEIRGATVWAQIWELHWLNEARKEKGLPPLHIGHVDFYRWFRGKKVRGPLPHICFTTDY